MPYKGQRRRLVSDFSKATYKARQQWSSIRKENANQRFLYPVNCLSRVKTIEKVLNMLRIQGILYSLALPEETVEG